ncbi:MAG: TerB family tellurite resistance protein [Mesorhizobium sp.]|nr:TerB family tellurite resistance protein [Mesorhizobium sp.]
MFERFLAFIKELAGETPGQAPSYADNPAVAAAALLFHVMDADGVRAESERAILEREISASYGIDGSGLADILRAAEEAERDAVDLYSFTRVLKEHLDAEGRIAFIGMMWEIVYADGVRDEVEDNIVWRVAELIGVERADRIRMRHQVQHRAPAPVGKGDGDETD